MVPRREALLGNTFETRNSFSRGRPAIASAITGSASPYISAVSICVMPSLDAPAQRGDGGLAVAAVEIPGALPDHGYVRAVRAEFFLFHDYLNF